MFGRIPLKVLILEDQSADAELMLDEMRQGGFEPEWWRVETKTEYLSRLDPLLDVILADHKLPQFDGLTALSILQQLGLDIPFILVSGSIGEELAVLAMKQGASDYLLKDRMTRLCQAISGAIEAKKLRAQKQQAESMLRDSEARFRTLVEQASDGIFIADSEGRYLQVNTAGCQLLGYTHEEILTKTMADLIILSPDRPETFETLTQGRTVISEREMVRKDGTLVPVEISAKQLPSGNFQAIVRDITERKIAEEKLRRLNRTLTLLSDVNQSIVRIRDLSVLYKHICRLAVDDGGFQMAWIGTLDYETMKLKPVAHAGNGGHYIDNLNIEWSDIPRGRGPAATALRTGEHVISNDIGSDALMLPWREDALKLGYRAVATFPLKVTSEVRGTFALYSDILNFFDDKEIALLDEMAGDISFAMEFAEQEVQRNKAEITLTQYVKVVEEMQIFFQTILDAFPAHTVVLDPDGTIINVNASWIRFASENGAESPTHYLGVNYLTICDRTTGPALDEAAAVAVGIRTVIEGTKEEFYLEYPCHSPTEKRWFGLQTSPFPGPAPRRVVLAHINITSRKLAEEELLHSYNELEARVIERTAELQNAKERAEVILNNSNDAILVVGPDLTIQQTNASFRNLFQCEQDDYLQVSLTTIINPDDDRAINQIIKAAHSLQTLNIDVELQRNNGTGFMAELNTRFLNDGSIVCGLHDITERKRFERSLQIAIQKEQELNELKSRFVSMASHEFRTPLATISAITETLSAYWQQLNNNQIDEKLHNILGQVGRLKDIMDDVLDLARLQARRTDYKPSTFNLDTLCRNIVDEFQSRPTMKHHLIYSCNNDQPLIRADVKLMRQIVSNLLVNAIKYSAEGTEIVFKLEYLNQNVILTIMDNGIGIPADDLNHLFEPFHRATNVGTIPGTGLGLVITKEAVDLHSGEIHIASQVGAGTTVQVSIPWTLELE